MPTSTSTLAGSGGSRGLTQLESYTSLQELTLPTFRLGSSELVTTGKFVFFSEDASQVFVIVRAATAPNTRPLFGLVRAPVSP